MDKAEHAARLRRAVKGSEHSREAIATAVGRDKRTITNWISETKPTMPSEKELVILRRLFPGYDDPGDSVEVAVRQSELEEWRQDTVVGFYKRHLSEQREGRRA